MAKHKTLRIWTNGRDVVAASCREDIPGLLDQHYRVTGHTLRKEWREIAEAGWLGRCSVIDSADIANAILKNKSKNL